MSKQFKTPLQHKASLADVARPQQSHLQSLAKDLGFDDDDVGQDDESGSGSGSDVGSPIPSGSMSVRGPGGSAATIGLAEYQALQRELEQTREGRQKAVEALAGLRDDLAKVKAEAERRKDQMAMQKTLLEKQHQKESSERDALINDLRDQVDLLRAHTSSDGSGSAASAAVAAVAALPSSPSSTASFETARLHREVQQLRELCETLERKLAQERAASAAAALTASAPAIVMPSGGGGGGSSASNEEVTALRAQLQQMSQKLITAASAVSAAEEQRDKALASRAEAQKAADQAAKLRAELESARTSGAQASDEIATRATRLQEELRVAQSALSAEKDAHTSAVRRLESEVASLRASGAEVSSASAAIRAEVDSWTKKHDEQVSRVRTLTDELSAVKAELQKTQAQLADAKASAQSATSSQAETAAAMAAARTAEQALRDQLAALTKQHTDASAGQAQLRASLADTTAQLSAAQSAASTASTERDSLKRKLDAAQAGSKSTARAAAAVATAAKQTRAVMVSTRKDAAAMSVAMVAEFRAMASALSGRFAGIEAQLASSVDRYRREAAARRKLHNQLVDLRGNIRVFCRCRPLTKGEQGKGDTSIVTFTGGEDAELTLTEPESMKRRQFEFDRVYTPDSTQASVFEDVEPLITSVLDGFNVCIFAYGQTGSGKTYTMEGPSDNPYNDPGVNIRALTRLFDIIRERSTDYRYRLVVSVLEIYNEVIQDLLADAKVDKERKHDVKEGPQGVFVENLTEVDVDDMESVRRLFATGHSNRHVAETMMNADSSRSHLVLTVRTIGENITTGQTVYGKLALVDLAGSERVSKSGATGQQLKEASFINLSLSALGNTINALHTKAAHVPYRDSKLTRLLQDSLGGNSKTLMFVQVSPAASNCSETLCSLQFAQRVRKVELGAAKRNTEAPESAGLRMQVKELQGLLTASGIPLPASAAAAPVAVAAAASAAGGAKRK